MEENDGQTKASDSAQVINPSLPTLEEMHTQALAALTAVLTSSDESKRSAAQAQEFSSAASTILEDIRSRVAEITLIATQAAGTKAKIDAAEAVIDAKSTHIHEAQAHADGARTDLDRAVTVATQSATEAEGLKTRAQTAADSSVENSTLVKSLRAQVDADALDITNLLTTAKEATNATKALSEKAESLENGITQHQLRLQELERECKEQLDTIVGLLPGATSAGLAHAFNERKQTFRIPIIRWQLLFVGSIGLITIIAGASLIKLLWSEVTPSYEDDLKMLLSRLPVILPLVWLAIHAAHEAALTKQLEEDYGYKAAIASSFQGFHEQMQKIQNEEGSKTALSQLCTDTLATIGSPPGRIYASNKLTVSLTGESKEVLTAVTEAVSSAIKKGT